MKTIFKRKKKKKRQTYFCFFWRTKIITIEWIHSLIYVLFVVYFLCVCVCVKSRFPVATSCYVAVPSNQLSAVPFPTSILLFACVFMCMYVSLLISFNEHVLILWIWFSSRCISNGRFAVMYFFICYCCCCKLDAKILARYWNVILQCHGRWHGEYA